MSDGAESYIRPAGLSLMFCSRVEIEAAPQEEREAYYRLVEGICTDPAAFGLKNDTRQWKRENGRLSDDETDYSNFSDENGDGPIY